MTIPLGPLMLAADRLIALAAIALFLFACERIGRRSGQHRAASRTAWLAVLAGIVAARLGFVAENWSAFAAEPVSALYLWQGGFSALWGAGAAAVVLLVGWRAPGKGVALGALAGLFLVWFALTTTLAHRQQEPLPANLVASRMNGAPVALDGLRGKPFVVNLWATWCPPCRREMPMLIEVAKTSPDVPILLLNQGESAGKVANFLHREQLAGDAILLDQGSAVSAALGTTAFPTTLFVDAKGIVRQVHTGEISRAALLVGMRKIATD